MFSERHVYVLYNVGSSGRILFPKVFGQCVQTRKLLRQARRDAQVTNIKNRQSRGIGKTNTGALTLARKGVLEF
jgi:hypothetical protein